MRTLEIRWDMRIPVRVPVRIRAPGGEPAPAVTRDLSFDGMFIEICGDAMAPGDVAEITLPPPAGARRGPVQAIVRVARRQADGMGVQFDGHTEELVAAISGLFEDHLRGLEAQNGAIAARACG